MDTNTRAEELTGFLRNLYGDRKVSLARATITDRGKTTQTFHEGEGRLKPWSMSIDGLARSMIKKSDQGVEIFYAPTPMSGNKGRKKEQALPNVVVFGDADEGLTADAKAKLIELGACLVRSGGLVNNIPSRPKYHVYLLLTEEVSPSELETLNRGLKAFIRGDKFDSTTLLRLPGTRNHKYSGSPIVKVERLADARHTPTNLLKFLGVAELGPAQAATTAQPLVLPTVPADFNPRAFKYARMRKVVREWNGRFNGPNGCRRYMATIAIVKDAIKYGFDMDEAYAFAMTCEPLLDKAEEENGYSIQKDVARTWRREAGVKAESARIENAMAPSGTLTADDIVSTPQDPDVKDKPVIGEVVPPKALTKNAPADPDAPNPYSSRDSRNYLDMAIFTSGDFKPLEPEYFSVGGAFCLLYPGMTHCIFGDSGSGKTWIVLAQIAEELKAGRKVKYIDFENGAMTIGNRLRNVLGVPAELLTPDHFKYMWFNDKPEAAEIDEEAEEDYDLVIIDGVDASLAMWDTDPNKATEIRAWYNAFPQRFADEGATVLSIDHTTKRSSKDTPPKDQQPGGAGTKLAVLTGAAFYVHPKEGYELIPGRRGIVEAYTTRKDKDGFLKSRAQKNGHLFDFIIDTVDGQTVVGFETVRTDIPTPENPEPGLNEHEEKVLDTLVKRGQPMSKTALRSAVGGRTKETTRIIEDLIQRGMINEEQGPRGTLLSPSLNAPPPVPGQKDLDFSRAGRVPHYGKAKRECRKCGDYHTYPDDFAQPDDIGYNPRRPMCKPCAAENIESESYIPRDGAEWARRIRERRDRHND